MRGLIVKRLISIFITVALILTPLSSCTPVSEDPPLMDAVKVALDTALVIRGNISKKDQFESYVRAQIHPVEFTLNSGLLQKIHVSLGDTVKKGDPIVELDTTYIDEGIRRAKDQLSHLRKKLAYDLEQKQFDIDIAKIDLDKAKADSLAQENIDLAAIAVERLQTEYKAIKDSAALAIGQAVKTVKNAEDQLEGTLVTSPCDGEVTYIESLIPGDRVSIHSPIVYIADPSDLYVQHNGSESISSKSRTTALIDGVEYALSKVEYEEREYIAMTLAGNKPPNRFLFEDSTEDIAAGTFASLIVYNAEREDVLYIPINSLYHSGSSSYVYIVENGEKIYTEVEYGLLTSSYAEIESGLEEGDVVFVKQ